jgi:DNA-binding CsgD family transcriptional regulator
MLGSLLDAAEKGRGTTQLLEGEGGQGKTRLVLATAERAAKRGWTVAIGRAYPVEAGVPYALFTDALLPVLRKLDPSTLSVLTRGAASELSHLFPLLIGGDAPIRGSSEPTSEIKTRLLWNFAQLLGRMAQKQPLLLVLENLHWADESSLEMLHFTARQIGSSRVLVLGTYNEASGERSPALVSLRQSLVALGAASVHHLEPLSRAATDELVHAVFGVSDAVSREFAALLYGWTRGNPFFVEETLKALVTSGRLYEREGKWYGWEIADLDLPRSIREAVVTRLDRLSDDAQRLAAVAAVIGTRASYEALDAVAAMPRMELVEAIDELRAERILEEHREGDRIVYDFSHPILRDVLYQDLGLARARLLHASVADALERHYGSRADEHADVLAYHFARADARDVGPKATHYLSLAGRKALAKHANREAASYLAAALERTRGAADAESEWEILEGLARARERLGEYDAAIALWIRAREYVQRANDLARVADIERRLGLSYFWSGRHDEALKRYDASISAAVAAGAESTLARARLAKGMCLQGLARVDDAEREMSEAIDLAERLGDATLLARAHRTQLLFYLWTGRTELAYKHAESARELAAASGQRVLEWLAHWALATLGGLTGKSEACARHLGEATRLAEELDSPVFRAWTAEIAVEVASATGEWETGLALAERTIALGRSVDLRGPFPRLLVWTAIIYLGRGDLERAKAYIDEAWELSGAGRGADHPSYVHSVVPAHIGLAAYHVATRNFAEAIRVGEAGLAIADRAGAAVWAVHRLLPILAESALEARDLRRAEKIGQRLRHDSERLGQRAGLAWADGCAALVAMLRGQTERAIVLLRDAAEALEAVPVVADGARVRKQLARLLAESGDRDGAVVELRRVHEVFVRLGAEGELALTRQQLRELGARPPARTALDGADGLTARELEIVRLVCARKSNKEIGRALNISPRTVSTHLTNIFTKLQVGSRGELADFVRERGLFTG